MWDTISANNVFFCRQIPSISISIKLLISWKYLKIAENLRKMYLRKSAHLPCKEGVLKQTSSKMRKLKSWEAHKLANWQADKLTNCQADKMTGWQDEKMTNITKRRRIMPIVAKINNPSQKTSAEKDQTQVSWAVSTIYCSLHPWRKHLWWSCPTENNPGPSDKMLLSASILLLGCASAFAAGHGNTTGCCEVKRVSGHSYRILCSLVTATLKYSHCNMAVLLWTDEFRDKFK